MPAVPAAPNDASGGDSWKGHERGSREFGRVRLALFFAGVVTFAQLYAPQAVLPEIATEFGIDASRASLMVSTGTFGVAASVLPWSLVADRVGRVRVMSISVISATVLGLVTAAMPLFELAVALRLLEGIALGGIPAVALAYLNEEVTRRAAPLVAGMFVAGNTMGGLIGRIVSAPIGELLGWRLGLLAVSVVAIVATLGYLWAVPEPRGFTPPPRGTNTLRDDAIETLRHVGLHLRTPALIGTYAQALLLMGGFVAIYNFLGFRLVGAPYDLPTWLASLTFLAYLTGSIASPIAGNLATRFPRKGVLLGCIAVTAFGLVLTVFEPLWLVIGGLVIFTGAFFAAHSVAAGTAGSIPTHGRAQSSALYNLCYYLGSSVFGYLGGLLYESFGWTGTAGMVLGLVLVSAAAAIALIPWRPPTGLIATGAIPTTGPRG
ncbi:MFS transporter [Pseudoclavibacter chungangensis]|uniref:MFS transporter n=1 Tax=Pseudoclavibacter chungangensis TaxID=587635 RepID=A0A7J5BPA7_9MICO|nr:MFS transporter [Pseudoclavibacter chungangensis]KAB1654796.1 MFS transporter [Pseudoclavibacter chungangensis]NYJ68091.1 putative MFS family arabinose efflux permease [Pseudoclavibacter chungangensis]